MTYRRAWQDDRNYLSLRDASDLFGLSERTLRRRIADGSLPAVRIGSRSIRVLDSDSKTSRPRSRPLGFVTMPPDKQERPDHKAEALHTFLTGESELSISSPVSDSDDGQGDNHDAPRKSQATRLVELALEQFRPLLSDDGRPYAVALDGPNVARPLRGRNGLREHLAKDTPTSPTARSLPHQR